MKALEDQVDMFEKKKLHDIKSLLRAFVTVELSFHSKAIEFFTRAFQEITDINEQEDLEVWYDNLLFAIVYIQGQCIMIILNTLLHCLGWHDSTHSWAEKSSWFFFIADKAENAPCLHIEKQTKYLLFHIVIILLK